MKLILLSLLSILSYSAVAGKADLLIVDPDIETKELESEFTIRRPKQFNSLPDRDTRDSVFEGISFIEKMDELGKDILYMDLNHLSDTALLKKYPEATSKDLKTMRSRK